MFLAFFLTVGCQEDLYNLEKKGTQRKNTISFSELKNRVDQKKVAYKGARSIFDKIKSNSLAKSASDFIQEVDTTNIIEIFKDGFSSFTLKVTTTDNDLQNLYNLVLVERNNEFKEILLKYHTNSTEELTPENFNGTVIAVNQDGIPTAIDVDDYDKTLYVECGSEIQLLCECVEHNPHCGGESTSVCPSQSGHVTGLVIAPLYCYINVPNGGDGNPTAPSTPSTPASPNNNNSGSNGINTTPNGGSNPASTKTKLVINKLKNPSNPLYSECYENSPQTFKDKLNTFLNNEFTDPNQSATDAAIEAFAKEASNAQCNGGEVDFDNGIILDSSFLLNAKAICVYNKLKTSSTFKNIFSNVFEETRKPFIILKTENLSGNAVSGTVGQCDPDFGNVVLNTITIDTDLIADGHPLQIAKTIAHEFIHAFLNIKLYNEGLGMTIPAISNLDFPQAVNQIYNGFAGNQDQHNFIYNFMIPTLQTILSEIKDICVTPQNNTDMLGLTVNIPLNSSPSTPFIWNEYFKNLALAGLQNCSFFQAEIGVLDSYGNIVNTINQTKMQSYNMYIQRGNDNLIKTCN